MFRRFSVVAGAMALAAVTAPSVSAQPLSGPSCSTTSAACVHTLTATVPTLVNLTLENATTAIGAVDAASFDAPQRVQGPQFEARANVAYTVLIASQNGTFGPETKSVGDVRYVAVPNATACSAAAGFTALSATATSIYSGARGASPRQRLCFDITWNYETDGPGAYNLPMNLTVTAP